MPKKFNQLVLKAQREKHGKRLKGREKGGAYVWDTEEERSAYRRHDKKRRVRN